MILLRSNNILKLLKLSGLIEIWVAPNSPLLNVREYYTHYFLYNLFSDKETTALLSLYIIFKNYSFINQFFMKVLRVYIN